MPEKVSNTPFSIDHLVTEVNTIVEDLRWLHFELKLRNHLNELLFHEVGSVEEFLKLGFEGFRAIMSVLELAIYLKSKQGYAIGFRDLEESVFWANDAVPWTDNLDALFRKTFEKDESPQPLPSHYSVNNSPITVITIPVVMNRDVAAAILLVAHTSNLIPRYKKVLSGLSVALSVSINYIKNLRTQYKPAQAPVKLADNSLPFEDVVNFLVSYSAYSPNVILIADSLGNILQWNNSAVSATGLNRNDSHTLADVRHVFDASGGEHNALILVQPGSTFDSIVAALRNASGIWKPYEWIVNRFGTSKGLIYVLTGWERVELDRGTGGNAPEPALAGRLKVTSILESSAGLYVAILDTSYRIVYMNPGIVSLLGGEQGRDFVEECIPSIERGYMREALALFSGSIERRHLHRQFHLLTASGGPVPVDWMIGFIPEPANGGQTGNGGYYWLIGSETPDELFQVLPGGDVKHFPYGTPEAKLSKQYRFLMKYVPFPIVHLDEEKDIIRNANPAFEAIVNSAGWESAPLSEFGALELHQRRGDAQPCTLFIPNSDGITVPHRGIVTHLQIFGKKIREIKFDSLDQ